MRILLTISACVLLFGNTGCLIPLPSKVTQGHRYSAEALAFLDLPGMTRDEVIESLGPPLLESTESRTLLYKWEETSRYLASVPHGVHRDVEVQAEVVRGAAYTVGLFIAYDARGVIEAHEVLEIGSSSLQKACANWREYRERKR